MPDQYYGQESPQDRDQEQWSQQPPQSDYEQTQSGQGMQRDRGISGDPREQVEQAVDRAIDQFASRLPGGEQYAQQAKEAVSNILDTLEREAKKRAGQQGGTSSGIFGGTQTDQSYQ